MSFQPEELLKHLPIEIQYQEIKASEEAYRKFRLSQVRGRICCFGLYAGYGDRHSTPLSKSVV
ncbi:MAG: hypothetical protein WBA41_22220 [Rivularia sp. (in: cyanobacteria)]